MCVAKEEYVMLPKVKYVQSQNFYMKGIKRIDLAAKFFKNVEMIYISETLTE